MLQSIKDCTILKKTTAVPELHGDAGRAIHVASHYISYNMIVDAPKAETSIPKKLVFSFLVELLSQRHSPSSLTKF